jgi:hypothetical protein
VNPAGHPDINTPIPGPWLSPKREIVNFLPNEFAEIKITSFYSIEILVNK